MSLALRLTVAASLLVAVACGDSDNDASGGGMVRADPPEMWGDTGGSGAETGGTADTCGATSLCELSIEECGVNLDQQTCEAWYDAPDSCRDMEAYVACNCDCDAETADCDGYFSCGEFCYEAHCL